MKNVVFVVFCFFLGARAFAVELDLETVMQKAQDYSPKIQAQKSTALASEQQIRIAKSNYLPSTDGAMIAADGSPGAFGLLGLDNNLSSAQRIGAGVGVVIKQMIYDFGRSNSLIHAAKSEMELEQKKKDLSMAQVAVETLQIYLQCAALRNQIEDANFTASQAHVIAQETDKFVSSGQRSIVERYLVDSQTMEAQTLSAQLTAQKEQFEHRLALQIGLGAKESISCLPLFDEVIEKAVTNLEKGTESNAMLDISKLKIQIAKDKVELSEAEARPSLIAIGNAGYFDQQLRIDRWNYSAGIGLSIPIFEGFRIDSETQKQKYELEAEERGGDVVQQYVEDFNLKLTGEVNSSRIQYEFLKNEIELAQKAFTTAKSRYLGYKGSMVDLRDALKNLNRVRLAAVESKRNLLIARGDQAIFNGVIKP